MSNSNEFIEEDFEMTPQLESMYILEQQRQEEEDYYQWEEAQRRKPAKIQIIKKKEGVNYDKV